MNPRHNKLFWTVCGIHVGIVFLLLLMQLIDKCSHEKPAEDAFFLDVLDEAQTEAAPAQTVEQPAPEPAPEKPKWKPAEVVRQNKRVTRQTDPTPAPQNKPTVQSVKKALGGAVDLFSSYYQSVFARYYAVWQQPATAPFGTEAVALITVERDGRISSSQVSEPSGVLVFDQSVQNALRRVQKLPPPPADLPSRTISITFVLSN